MANDHLQLDSVALSSDDLAALAMAGGAFDDLEDENDLYNLMDGAEVGAG